MAVVFHKMKEHEITEIYENHMRKDFPPMELKPLHHIIDMMEEGIYESLLVYLSKDAGRSAAEEDTDREAIGYALVLLLKDCPYGLLDYFGTFSDKRNQGYGSRILSALNQYYQDRMILIESEYPADAPDQKMAERRVGFYQRNGAVDTGVESRVFGAHYIIFALVGPESAQNQKEGKNLPAKETVKEILEQLYAGMLPDAEKRRKYLEFWNAV